MDSKTEKQLRAQLKMHARALDIPPGAAEDFISHTVKDIQKSLRGKATITTEDFDRLVAKELQKYHADLAYVYQNYGKII